MYELKRVTIKSSARVASFVGAVAYAIFALISFLVSGTTTVGSGAVALVVGTVLFGIIGSIVGAVMAWLYNLVARLWGGLYLDFHLLPTREPRREENKTEYSHEDS